MDDKYIKEKWLRKYKDDINYYKEKRDIDVN